MFSGLLSGIGAGAAGTTALNAVTYVDMAVRGRPASNTPEEAVEKLSERTDRDIPGQGEERQNRVSGLGPLLGIGTGVGVGAVAGLLRPALVRLPLLVSGALLGAAAMALSDLPMTRLGVTDPSTWSPADWVSDAAPHLAYGLVTAAVLRATSSSASE